MGNYDPRDPSKVAKHIHEQLNRHWALHTESYSHQKPKLVVIQGDPLSERGISAITRQVATLLGVSRGLVCLDGEVAEYHSSNADRANVILEHEYSDLANLLEENQPGILKELESTVDRYLKAKNTRRESLGMPPLKEYFRDFALLQEVTKAACCQTCGSITVAHTANSISEFSVTSFYEVGLELGLVDKTDFVSYDLLDELDFAAIDKR